MSMRVERFAKLSFRSLVPPVNQFVNSATYSPAQPIATKQQEKYSANSHRDSAFEKLPRVRSINSSRIAAAFDQEEWVFAHPAVGGVGSRRFLGLKS